MEATDQCVICQEKIDNFDNETINRLPCLHIFHTDCITQWLDTSDLCPVCRHPVDDVVEVDDSESSSPTRDENNLPTSRDRQWPVEVESSSPLSPRHDCWAICGNYPQTSSPQWPIVAEPSLPLSAPHDWWAQHGNHPQTSSLPNPVRPLIPPRQYWWISPENYLQTASLQWSVVGSLQTPLIPTHEGPTSTIYVPPTSRHRRNENLMLFVCVTFLSLFIIKPLIMNPLVEFFFPREMRYVIPIVLVIILLVTVFN